MKQLYKYLFAVCALLLILSGCGGETPPPENPETPDDNPITVVIPSKPAVDVNSWELVLVNRDNALSGELNVALTAARIGYAPMGYKVDERILPALTDMFDAALADGVNLYITSAYRSISKQQELYDNKINYYLGRGYSQADAVKLTEEVLSIPGRSEHHTGLAVDITSEDWVREAGGELTEDFATSAAGRWLAEHCAEYGFILRYPQDKESITKISFEPWHLRYVGKESAKYITESSMCLEEYINFLSK